MFDMLSKKKKVNCKERDKIRIYINFCLYLYILKIRKKLIKEDGISV